MKSALTFLLALSLSMLALSPVAAADDPHLAAVKAADDKRVAAMKSPDQERLNAVFSDELRYAHSTGSLDTKASLIDVLMSGKTKYFSYEYEDRVFTFPVPGIALMTGRAHVKVATATGDVDSVLSFLSVWREEKGQWRFLAWQSCKIPPPTKAP